MAKRGRPTNYDPELTSEICRLITIGKSLVTICKDPKMPNRDTIYAWLDKYPEFSDKYTRAKKDQADFLAEDIDRIADETLEGKYKPYAAQVAIAAKQWSASKLRPLRYGDKLDITSDGEKLPTPIGTVVQTQLKKNADRDRKAKDQSK